MKKKTGLVMSLISLRLLAGCGNEKPSEGGLSNEVPISDIHPSGGDQPLPSASTPSSASSSKTFRLTDSYFDKYKSNVYLEETEYENISGQKTAYAFEVAAKADTTITYTQYEGVTYEDDNNMPSPSKDSVLKKETRFGKKRDDGQIELYYRTGISLDNTSVEKSTGKSFTNFANPFLYREADDFEYVKDQSTAEYSCYKATALPTTRARRFFAPDHSEDSKIKLDSFLIYIDSDSILSFELTLALSDKTSVDSYQYIGKIISTDIAFFQDKIVSPFEGSGDLDLQAAFDKIYHSTNYKEKTQITLTGADGTSTSRTLDTSLASSLRTIHEEAGEDTQDSFRYVDNGSEYYDVVHLGDLGYYAFGYGQELPIVHLSSLLFDKKGDGLYSIKDTAVYSITGTIGNLTPGSYRTGLANYSLSSLDIDINDNKVKLTAQKVIVSQGASYTRSRVSELSSFGTASSPVEAMKIHKTCDDLTRSERLSDDDDYEAVSTALGGTDRVNSIPVLGGTYSLVIILSAPDADNNLPCGEIGYYLGTQTMTSSEKRKIATSYSSKLKTAGFTVTKDVSVVAFGDYALEAFKTIKDATGNKKTLKIATDFTSLSSTDGSARNFFTIIPSIA